MRTLPALILAACATAPSKSEDDVVPPPDAHSYADPGSVRADHISLDLRVDFTTRTLDGTATLRVTRRDPSAPLILDTSGLEIRAVRAGTTTLAHELAGPDPVLGARLAIPLPPGVDEVAIDYRTSPDAAALQWLEPSQTAGGAKPFLFSQGQAILTRSWIPLQDTPGVRVTWDARLRVDPSLGVAAVMSAVARHDDGRGAFRFAMDRAVPSYLIALAVGDLESRDVSPRCAVWAEPGVVERAAYEFADTEKMIDACEELYGPYRWGRYDVLVLPPSFPFGGMENPCLTFATPTILAGDRSLVALIAHELAHSWSGNLVTNATWRDFWLNEGFTVYLEQRIVEAIYGPARARMETILGLQQLARELRTLPKQDQHLWIDLDGRNPDDGMTAVAYDKGAAFLRQLEHAVGRERFDAFLTSWFDAHAFRSVTTAEFLDWLESELPEAVARVDVDAWVRGPGIPDDALAIECEDFALVDTLARTWLSGANAASLDTAGWTTSHWLRFLAAIPDTIDGDRLAELDAAFGLTEAGNAEIAAAWLRLAVAADYSPAHGRLDAFLVEVGRRKFLKPLYEQLVKTEAGRARAREIYARARPRYHAISRRTIDEIVGRSE